ncbi:secreted RxLR effector protein 161-like [Solanum verrucosum]|uniref:secreted RxLR effector protein 161-like n=1 Tax=Solanum verrucosum TaxID=315347 RepID=UPI0020D1259B|nr:secreted RxLR effector protein 161-like [Solanum verrucosum]
MYLANATRPDIEFSVNLLARYSSSPTRRYWNEIKHILRYLKGTSDMGLFYTNKDSADLVGHADAGYLSDPHKARSQTRYLFTYRGTAVSWRSTKQSIVAIFSNHAEIIAIHEASRECVWLRSVIHFTKEDVKNGDIDIQQIRSSDNPTDLFTKSLPTSTLEKMLQKIGMRRLASE